MEPPLAIMIATINTVFILSSAGVIAYWLRLRHQRHHLPKVTEQLEEMRDAIAQLRDRLEPQVEELQERLDFAERMLTRGGGSPDEPPDGAR